MSKHLQNEITQLKQHILAVGAVVEESVYSALKALSERDAALAQHTIALDDRVDRMEVELEEECLKVMALHQPVAIDLRLIISILKINNDLERIADLAVNIAERALYLAGKHAALTFDFEDMAERTKAMLKRSLDALVEMDADLARQVCAADDEIDAINRQIYTHAQEHIRQHPEDVDTALQMISVSRNLERLADLTTNIAEDVIYMAEGDIVRHRRFYVPQRKTERFSLSEPGGTPTRRDPPPK